MKLLVKRMHPQAKLPTRGSAAAAGYDLYSDEALVIGPGQRAKVSTGIRMALPEGTYGDIGPRSGHADKFGIDTLGRKVDSDYRGEIFVMLINHGQTPFPVHVGDRIAQMIVHEYVAFDEIETVNDLPETARDRVVLVQPELPDQWSPNPSLRPSPNPNPSLPIATRNRLRGPILAARSGLPLRPKSGRSPGSRRMDGTARYSAATGHRSATQHGPSSGWA